MMETPQFINTHLSATLYTTAVVIHTEVIKILKGTLGLVGIGTWGLELPSVALPPPEHTCLIMQWLGSLALFML